MPLTSQVCFDTEGDNAQSFVEPLPLPPCISLNDWSFLELAR